MTLLISRPSEIVPDIAEVISEDQSSSLEFLSQRAADIVRRSEILNNPTLDTSWLFNDPRIAQLIEYIVEAHGSDVRKYGPGSDPVPAAAHDLRVAQICRNMPSFRVWIKKNNQDTNLDIAEALTHDIKETMRSRSKRFGTSYRPKAIESDLADIWGDRTTFQSIRACIAYATDDDDMPDALRIEAQENKSVFAPTDQRAVRGADKIEQNGWDSLQRIRGNLPDAKVHLCWKKSVAKSFVTRFSDLPEIKPIYDEHQLFLAYEDRKVSLLRAYTEQAHIIGKRHETITETRMLALRGQIDARGGLSVGILTPES